jgi:hypothetical protein
MRLVKVALISQLLVMLLFALAISHAQSPPQPTSSGTAVANGLDSGLINAHYTITSNHTAFVMNNSGIPGEFLYEFDLCAQNFTCTSYIFPVYLTNHQGVNVSFIVSKDIIYTTPGRYVFTAKTMITGPSVNVLVQGTATGLIINPNVLPPPGS